MIEAYRAAAAADGTLDFEEKSAVAAQALRNLAGEGLADHVLVDEAQDLSPSRLMFLRALAAPGKNDLFIAEDSHQRIYGQPIVLGRYGINIVGRSRRLTLNYRTTEQNLRYALGILSGAELQRPRRRAGEHQCVPVGATRSETESDRGDVTHRRVRHRRPDCPYVARHWRGAGVDRPARPHPQGRRIAAARPRRPRRVSVAFVDRTPPARPAPRR
ncbi:UvrD-helicase domain-containing protein [Rhodococcus hoagii]|nr:UvrD-helicase domain-containing protein [Prescottella equi]